jgi:hypothetical protein
LHPVIGAAGQPQRESLGSEVQLLEGVQLPTFQALDRRRQPPEPLEDLEGRVSHIGDHVTVVRHERREGTRGDDQPIGTHGPVETDPQLVGTPRRTLASDSLHKA